VKRWSYTSYGGSVAGVDSWNKATGKVPGRKQIFWDWVCATYKRAPEFWERYILGGGGPPGFYCSPTNTNFSIPYCKALDQITNRNLPRRLWSVTPYKGCQANPTDFSADSPKCDPGVSAVVQYAINCNGGLIDLDLANDDGFNSMWKRSPR
jgi:hypothetical protein